jgi:hypothetical protein
MKTVLQIKTCLLPLGLIIFLTGCQLELESDEIIELSNKYLNNCDFVESEIRKSFLTFKSHDFQTGIELWQERQVSIREVINENLQIASQLESEPFKNFSLYLSDLTEMLNTLYISFDREQKILLQTDEKLEKSPVIMEADFQAEMGQYHYNLNKLIPHYFKFIQKAGNSSSQSYFSS